jgi:hypothetical protein
MNIVIIILIVVSIIVAFAGISAGYKGNSDETANMGLRIATFILLLALTLKIVT